VNSCRPAARSFTLPLYPSSSLLASPWGPGQALESLGKREREGERGEGRRGE